MRKRIDTLSLLFMTKKNSLRFLLWNLTITKPGERLELVLQIQIRIQTQIQIIEPGERVEVVLHGSDLLLQLQL